MPLLSESDAIQVRDTFDLLGESERPLAKQFLSRYADQQAEFGAPLYPTEEATAKESRDAYRAQFAGLDKVTAEVSPYSDDPERDRAIQVNIPFLAERFGISKQEVADRPGFYRGEYARQKFGAPADIDDKAFYQLAAKEINDGVAREKIANDGATEGMRAALAGQGTLDAMPSLAQEAMDSPENEDRHGAFFKAYAQTSEVLAKHRGTMATLLDAGERSMLGKAKDGDEAALTAGRDALIAMPGQERRIVLAAMQVEGQKRGEKNGADKGKFNINIFAPSFSAQAATAGGRLLSSGIQGMSDADTVRVLDGIPTAGNARSAGPIATMADAERFVSDYLNYERGQMFANQSDNPAPARQPGEDINLTAEQTALIVKAKDKLERSMRVSRELDAIGSAIDPVPNVFASTIGTSAALVGVMAASRGMAAPMIAGLYKGVEYNDLSLKYPQMSEADKTLISATSAAVQTAGDFISFTALSKMPGLKSLIAGGWRAEVVKRAGLRAAGVYAVENAVEAGQDAATPLLMRALASDVPGYDWEQEKADFWKGRADVAMGMLPLTLLGIGASTVQEYRGVKSLLSWSDKLGSVGVVEADRIAISEAAQAGKTDAAAALLREAWGRRSPEVAAEFQAGMTASEVETQNATAEMVRRGMLPDIRRDGSGYVVTADGKSATFSTWEQARDVASQHMNEREIQQADLVASMADSLNLGAGESIDINQRGETMGQRVASGVTTPEDALEAAVAAGILKGMDVAGARSIAQAVFGGESADERSAEIRKAVESIVVLGSNRVTDGKSISTVSLQGNASPFLTVVEETVEGRWKGGVTAKRFTKAQGVSWVKMAEAATGESFTEGMTHEQILASAEETPRALTEAISRIVVADVLGRMQSGQRIAPGSISRGLDRTNREQSALAAILDAFREFFKTVLDAASKLMRAREDGTLGADYDALFDALTGGEGQHLYEQETLKEQAEFIDTSGYSEDTPGPNGETFSLVTPAQDAEYMTAIESGDMATAQAMVDEAAKAAGYGVGPLFHGGNDGFDIFSFEKMGEQGTSEGKGFYFTNKEEIAKGYVKESGGRFMRVMLLSGKRLDGQKKTITRAQLGKVIDMIDPSGEDFLANYGDVHYEGRNKVKAGALNNLIDFSESDVDLVAGMINSGVSPEGVYDAVEKVTGKLGIVEKGGWGGDGHEINIATSPRHIKLADAVTRDGGGNIIPLSQRFNSSDSRITFSLAAAVESEKFKAWFKESKVVEGGKPLVVYHGAPDVRGIFSEGFKAFSRGSVFFATDSERKAGTYADDRRSPDYQNAEPGIIPLYLSIQRPVIIDAKGGSWTDGVVYHAMKDAIARSKSGEVDGVIIENVVDDYTTTKVSRPARVFVWFNPSQAKSALSSVMKSRVDRLPIAGANPNSGEFSADDPRISFSLVTPAQDAEYMAAVKSGDVAKQSEMVEAAAKAAGYDVKAFHGTSKNFKIFKAQYGRALWFSEDRAKIAAGEAGAQGIKKIMPVFLRTGRAAGWDEYNKLGEGQIARDFESVHLDDDWIIFAPENVKSAEPATRERGEVVPLSKRFNPESNRITFALIQLSDKDREKMRELGEDGYVRAVNESGKWHAADSYQVTANKLATYVKLPDYGELLASMDGVEYRVRNEKIKHVKYEGGEIARGPDGLTLYMSDGEALAAGRKIARRDMAAFVDGLPVGTAADEWGAVLVLVSDEYRGKGIGPQLAAMYRSENPWKDSGGFTEAGMKQVRKVYQFLVNGKPLSTSPVVVAHAPINKASIDIQGIYTVGELNKELWSVHWTSEGEEFVSRNVNAAMLDGDETGERYAREYMAGVLISREARDRKKSTFSLRSGDFAARMEAAMSPFNATPEARQAMGKVALERVQRVGAEWIVKAANLRGSKSINKEAAMREAKGYEERVTAYLDSLSEGARQSLEWEPSKLADEPLIAAMLGDVGRLMSRSKALELGKFDLKSGDYDGAPWLPPSFYSKGAGLAPDKMAQALYDLGMLPDAYTDTLWSALAASIASVRKDRVAYSEASRAYSAAKRAARADSKAEVEAWANKERQKAGSNKAQRDMLKGGLRTLDALLSAFPPEVRVKVGGYVKLAGLATDEAMLDEIERRIVKLEEEATKWLRKEGLETIELLFKKAAADYTAGKKAKGKIGADEHHILQRTEAASRMTGVQVLGEIANLDARIESGELTTEQEILARVERSMIELAGNLFPRSMDSGAVNKAGRPVMVRGYPGADVGRLYSAIDAVRDLMAYGAWSQKQAEIAKRERWTAMREALIEDTGKEGSEVERREAADRMKTFVGKSRAALMELSSFNELLTHAFGSGSAYATAFVDAERDASNDYEDEIQEFSDELDALFTRLAGGKVLDGERLRFDMSQPSITAGTSKLSQLEAIQALLMWRQEDGRRHMEGNFDENGKLTSSWGYDQSWIDTVTNGLTSEGLEVFDWIARTYSVEHAEINPLYRRRNGVNMPKHANYAPVTVTPMQAKASDTVNPLTGAPMNGGILSPGSLRTRSTTAVAEPKFRDAVATIIAHKKMMGYWKHYYDVALEANAILGNREVANAVEAKIGAEGVLVLSRRLSALAMGGVRDASAGLALTEGVRSMTNRAATIGLLGRVSTLLIQSTQLAASSVKMPVGAYLSRFGKLMTGNLAWGDAIRSEFIQRRIKSAPPIVRQAMQNLASAKRPNEITRMVRRLGETLSNADGLFTAGTYAILLDYHRTTGAKLGLSGAELESHATAEATRETEQVAQPTRDANRSFRELAATDPLAKIAWAYASEARQKLALFAWAALDTKSRPDYAAKVAFLTFGVGGLLTQVIKNSWRELGGDDDEKKWSPERLVTSMLTSPLHGVPVVGSLLGDGNMLSGFSRAGSSWERITSLDYDDPVQVTRDVDVMLSAAGLFNDNLAGLSAASHIGLDLSRLLQNAFGE